MKIILLGTGTPGINITNPRGGSTAALVIGDDVLLFDCGRWTTLRLCQAGIQPNRVTNLFFTHIFHFDHTCNYYDFLMSVRPGKINIYGPSGTREYTEKLLRVPSTYGEARVSPILNWVKDHTTDVEKGMICSGDNWKVIGADVDSETNWRPNIVYRVEHGNFSAVIAWDIHPMHSRKRNETLKFDDTYTSRSELMGLMEGADVVLADALGIHTTPEGIGVAAEKAKVKKIVLTHITEPSGPPPPTQPRAQPRAQRRGRQRAIDLVSLKESVKKVFGGEVIIGEDLMEL